MAALSRGLLGRRSAWALAVAGIAVACGSSSDLDFADMEPGSSVGGVSAVTPAYGGSGAIVGPTLGGTATIGPPPMAGRAGGGIVLYTGGTASSYCAPGYACSVGSMCGNASMTCQCVGGAWACSGVIIGTGGMGTGATGAGGAATMPGFWIDAGGYVVSGTWHGYAWAAGVTSAAAGAGTTTIYPPDYSTVAAGATALCAQGTIGAASDYGGVALIGVNVNQAQGGLDGGAPPMGTVAIGGYGITVQYANPGGTQIRVQVQTPAGETDATGRWCAILSGAGGTETLPWGAFWGGVADGTQGCWNSGGIHPPIGTQISSVSLLVPGSNAVAVPYSMCLLGIVQV